MDFTSKVFIAFLVPVLGLHALFGWWHASNRAQNTLIAVSSVSLYALWYPPALALLGINALVLWGFGRFRVSARYRPWGLALGVGPPLLVLFVFKYFDFFSRLLELEGRALGWALPVGISFYTFTVVGYVVDLDRRPRRPLTPTEATLVVAFWPHLAAGPILRSRQILGNIRHKVPLTPPQWTLAFLLIFGGATKKLLVADNLGAYVNANLSHGVDKLAAVQAISTLLGFGGQIYADFSGYSDMAIGFALLLGFRLPANFAQPYRSLSLTEFWRRWHISLSQWFRDYLYIPLGGSRVGYARSLVNLFVVFVLSGLWHGAGVNFVVWGTIHGSVLIVEKLTWRQRERLPAALRWAMTFMVVLVAWAFFRLEMEDAWLLIARASGINARSFSFDSPYYVLPIWGFLSLIVLEHLLPYYQVSPRGNVVLPAAGAATRQRVVGTLAAVTAAFVASLFLSGRPLPFIYFNF